MNARQICCRYRTLCKYEVLCDWVLAAYYPDKNHYDGYNQQNVYKPADGVNADDAEKP